MSVSDVASTAPNLTETCSTIDAVEIGTFESWSLATPPPLLHASHLPMHSTSCVPSNCTRVNGTEQGNILDFKRTVNNAATVPGIDNAGTENSRAIKLCS
jgi:hypothetical protein